MAESNAFGIPRIKPLRGNNYALWSMRVGALIRSRHLFDIISSDEPIVDVNNKESFKAHNEWLTRNDEVYGLIILTLSAKLVMTVRGITNAKQLWELLKKRYEGVERQRRTQLKINLARIEKNDMETIDEYLTRAQVISNEILELGTKIEENELIGFIIEGLPKKYSEVTTAISSNPDITYDVMRETLLRFERKYDRFQTTESKAFRVNERRKIECYNCGKLGHIARNCWNKLKVTQTRNEGNSEGYRKGLQQERKSSYRNKGFTRENKDSNRKTKEYTCFVNECVKEEEGSNEVTWTLDSACTSHMTHKNDIIFEQNPEITEIATAENNRTIEAKYRGNLHTIYAGKFGETMIKLTDVLYVPKLNGNLMSVPSLVKKGKQVIFDDTGATIYEKDTGKLIAAGTFENNTFTVRLLTRTENESELETCLRTNEVNREVWHRRLGHVNYAYIDRMVKEDLVRGMERLTGKERKCEACIRGKLTRSPFKSIQEEGTTDILERLHVDLCGPMKIQSLGGNRYMLMVVDEFSRRYFVEFVQKKSEVPEKLINIIERRENETGKRVKSVRSDNGTEFTNELLMNYYKKKGIKCERTTIHSPQSNGIAERANRSVIDMARTLLIDAGLPMTFWAESVWTAVYIHNIVPTAARDKTPLELWTKRKPTIQHLKTFGCKAFYRNEDVKRKKFDARSKPAVFIGYSRDRRAYRVYDLKERRIKESRDVVFIEDEMGYMNDSTSENLNAEEFEYIEILPRPNPLSNANIPEQDDAQPQNLEVDELRQERENTQENCQNEVQLNTGENTVDKGHVRDDEVIKRKRKQKKEEKHRLLEQGVRRSSRERKPTEKYMANIARENIPKNYKDVLNSKNKQKWLEAIKKELNSLEEYKTWKVVDKPRDAKILRSKWIFTLKSNGENIKYKARLVADGSRQQMGRDYKESYSPVMKTDSFRTLLAIAATKNYKVRYFDVETAYLNGKLDTEVYMNPPEGLEIEGGKVLLVTGSLYGLPEAGRCWYEKLREILAKNGLQPCKSDPCVFINENNNDYIVVGMYVDDGIIIGKSDILIDNLTEGLRRDVKIKELNEKVKFLGIDIERDEDGFLLGQVNYVEQILERYNMKDCKSVKSPGVIGTNLDEYENSLEVDVTLYQEMLGSICYLVTSTRPDLAFTVSKLSQYAKDPREIHLQAIKRVLRYLQGTKHLKLRIGKNKGKLSISSDASWCTTQDSKSFGGYTVKIGESLIGWKSNKQKMVSLSTMESELMSLCDAVCETKWMINLLEELGQTEMIERPIQINTDSQSVIDWIKNPRVNNRNKHIARKYHFVKDERKNGEIEVSYISTHDLEADIMTKDLGYIIMTKHIKSLGLIEDHRVIVRKEGLKNEFAS